jgi:hypothetical protein
MATTSWLRILGFNQASKVAKGRFVRKAVVYAMAIISVVAFLFLEAVVGPFCVGAGVNPGNIFLIRVAIFAAFVIGGLGLITTRLQDIQVELRRLPR